MRPITVEDADFNPLPPCGGRLRPSMSYRQYFVISIHSLRVEGDVRKYRHCDKQNDFNPLPPCGGRQYRLTVSGGGKEFQSTPSVWRETPLARQARPCARTFQSTPSVWRETCTANPQRSRRNFNPLPPCGGRPYVASRSLKPPEYFNPLPPCGGRRDDIYRGRVSWCISIHSLRVEGDGSGVLLRTLDAISIHSLRVEGDR